MAGWRQSTTAVPGVQLDVRHLLSDIADRVLPRVRQQDIRIDSTSRPSIEIASGRDKAPRHRHLTHRLLDSRRRESTQPNRHPIERVAKEPVRLRIRKCTHRTFTRTTLGRREMTLPARQATVVAVLVALLWTLDCTLVRNAAQASPAGVGEAGTPPHIVVDGVEIAASECTPSFEDGEWWLVASPIATALHVELTYDPDLSSVSAYDPLEQVSRRYEGLTGQLTRDETTQAFLPAGLLSGTDANHLKLPLTVLSGLLDVEVWISPRADQVSLTPRGDVRRVGRESTNGWRMREVEYRAYGNRYGDTDRGDLTVDTRSESGPREFRTSLAIQGSSSTPTSFRTGRGTYGDESRRIQAGDIGTSGLAWQRVSGRGFDWSERASRSGRVFGSAAQQLQRIDSEAGDGRPQFRPWVLNLGYRRGALAGSPAGKFFGLGASWMEAATAWSLTTESGIARPGFRTTGRAGATYAPHAAAAYGWELDALLEPSRALQLQLSAAELGQAFVTPGTAELAGSARRSVGVLLSPFQRLTLRAHHSLQLPGRDRNESDTTGDATPESGSSSDIANGDSLGDSLDVVAPLLPEEEVLGLGWSRYTTADASATLPYAALRSFAAGASWSEPNGREKTTVLSTSARGRMRWLDWFWYGRHPVSPATANVLTSGLSWNANRVGRIQVVGSWSGGSISGGSWLLSARPLFHGRLQATIGQLWAHSNTGTDFRPFARVRWHIASGHTLDCSVQESGNALSLRVSLRGSFGFGGRNSGTELIASPAYQRHVGEVSGRLYLDHDMDGVYGPGDRPLRGVVLRLDRGRRTTQTDEDGRYLFLDVDAGEHQVSVDPGTIRADYVLLDPLRRGIFAASFERRVVHFRVGMNRRIDGVVFYDRNGNGRWDEGELPAAEVHLVLGRGQDTLTYPDGSFRLGDVPPGRQVLRIDDESIDPDYRGPGSLEILVPTESDPERVEIGLRLRDERVLHRRF